MFMIWLTSLILTGAQAYGATKSTSEFCVGELKRANSLQSNGVSQDKASQGKEVSALESLKRIGQTNYYESAHFIFEVSKGKIISIYISGVQESNVSSIIPGTGLPSPVHIKGDPLRIMPFLRFAKSKADPIDSNSFTPEHLATAGFKVVSKSQDRLYRAKNKKSFKDNSLYNYPFDFLLNKSTDGSVAAYKKVVDERLDESLADLNLTSISAVPFNQEQYPNTPNPQYYLVTLENSDEVWQLSSKRWVGTAVHGHRIKNRDMNSFFILDHFPMDQIKTVNNDSGFQAGGKNSSESIEKLVSINGKLIADIEKDLWPGGLLPLGYMGKSERLKSLLIADNETVRKLGVTFQQLAHPLIAAIIFNWKYHINDFLYNGQRYQVTVRKMQGSGGDPFNDKVTLYGDYTVVKVNTGETLSFAENLPFLMYWYGFCEGLDNLEGEGKNSFRLDPIKVKQFFEIR